MERFSNKQKIRVVNPDEDESPFRRLLLGRTGIVTRLRMKDNGAWVQMDQPLPGNLRVFPDDDARADHILMYPDECEPDLLSGEKA